MTLIEHVTDRIRFLFKEQPYRFFTEHDIHTSLAFIVNDYLERNETALAKTADGRVVNRVHHEYPTPFRCDMTGYGFRLISEEEFRKKNQEHQGFRARRGYIDLAVLNSDFVSLNDYVVVSGKRYNRVLSSLESQKFPALDLAIEVVYHPALDDKEHEGIMSRRVDSTVQDYKKMVALRGFNFNGNRFCGEAAMFFFSNTRHKSRLEALLEAKVVESPEVKFARMLFA